MPSKTWGTPLKINEYVEVGNNDEIPKGQKAYVFGMQSGTATDIPEAHWNALMSGDMTEIKNQIEGRIKGARCVFIAISWETANRRRIGSVQYGTERYVYDISGIKIEAVVENVSASLTGLEIVTVIIAVAFLAAVIGLIIMAGWVIWRIISAAEQLGPAATIGVGIVVLTLIVLLLLVALGGRAEYKGKKRRFKIGRG